MFQVTALYSHPEDTAAFDKHYREVHSVLAGKLTGLRKYTISWPAPGPDGAKPSYYLVATLFWDTAEEFQAALGAPEGEAVTADIPKFAGAGVDLMTGPAEDVA